MQLKSVMFTLMGAAAVAEASVLHNTPTRSIHALDRRQNRGGNRGGGGNGGNGGNGGGQGGGNGGGGGNAANTCLQANAVQTGSASTGQNGDIAAGQVESKTDTANFINFCSGETLTDGKQVKTGSCNGVVMGKIPGTDKMVSTVITSPALLEDVTPNQTFDVKLKIANMQLGAFTNAQETYYSAPQDLNNQGQIIGHTHVTIQDAGKSFAFTQPLDASRFVFFLGVNDAGDGQGNLKATVTDGLPKGNYRVCTMSGASNHQPVLMPVAQRGSQEDCRYFTVGGGVGNGGNGGGNGGNGGNGGGQGGNGGGQGGNGGGGRGGGQQGNRNRNRN